MHVYTVNELVPDLVDEILKTSKDTSLSKSNILHALRLSRDFGFGHNLTSEELDIVNQKRKNKYYLDKDAAIEVNNTSEK